MEEGDGVDTGTVGEERVVRLEADLAVLGVVDLTDDVGLGLIGWLICPTGQVSRTFDQCLEGEALRLTEAESARSGERLARRAEQERLIAASAAEPRRRRRETVDVIVPP